MVTVSRLTGFSTAVFVAGVLFSIQPVASAKAGALQTKPSPTFSKDVLPIMQRSCQSCHRPGTPAPMSMMTFAEVRPWAKVIIDIGAGVPGRWHD